ncbi:MAG TPA: muconolactone Delta-isomerase family protein [Amaricoccus sp.]|nr:muconolactone Delta-isomerase family protein [Amaricoccus sp.]
MRRREGILWRIAGEYANVSIFDVADRDELHALLSTLPLFPFMTVAVTPLARHPSALDQQRAWAGGFRMATIRRPDTRRRPSAPPR